jgi:beta-N-acetylhexosaminidase
MAAGAMRVGAATAAAAIPALTDRQLAGQRVIYSYKGLTPPPGLLRRIRHGKVAGIIFFGGNISSRTQIAAVIHELEHANASSLNPVRAPLLLMTDQEGGLVRRLPGAPLLSEKEIGQSTDPAAEATSAGTGAGNNLLGVGMNVNLAPVDDIYRHAGDFYDQYGRAYSSRPSKVARLGADFITAQQATGVAATAKHFPGLGSAAASQNTDVGPVTLYDSLTRIRTIDELPYKSAIAARVKLVMLCWASFPNIGSRRPAGLSSKIVKGELRRSLGFSGVTITDAIEAGGLRGYGSIGHRSLLAALAGMDLILSAGQNVSHGDDAVSALENGYRYGALNRTAFRAAVARVIALRSSLPG